MFTQEKLAYLATLTVVGIIAAMWFTRDVIVSAFKVPGKTREQSRLLLLRIRGMQDYSGQHRLEGKLTPA